ncbi:MAG: zinc-binding dehydrogenase [Phycisphaerales bacterium]|nr:MAG: zinc-binding dehydrogenase [Phycisphaerales bacterium]
MFDDVVIGARGRISEKFGVSAKAWDGQLVTHAESWYDFLGFILMRAVTIREHGGLDVVRVEEIPEPELADDEVLVEVRSAGLNHLDIWVRKGGRSSKLTGPHVLGSDASGVVVGVGERAKGVTFGDEVVLNPGLSCGVCDYCRGGEQSECVSFGILGLTRQGTFAERVAVPARNLAPKPSHLSFNEAGAFVLAQLTAWRMLMTRAQLKPGQTVLIHGIGGGVALCALQLAKLAGAQTIVTSSSDEKLDRASRLGADHVINYKVVDDVAQCVKELTRGLGVDIIIDAVGTATWSIDFSAVRRGGKVVLCGVTSGAEAATDLRALYWNQLTIMGSTMGSDEDFRQMVEAVTAAKLRPVIDLVKPLENIKDAMGKMGKAEQFGKIVLEISR